VGDRPGGAATRPRRRPAKMGDPAWEARGRLGRGWEEVMGGLPQSSSLRLPTGPYRILTPAANGPFVRSELPMATAVKRAGSPRSPRGGAVLRRPPAGSAAA